MLIRLLKLGAATCLLAGVAQAATIVGPTPYLAQTDTPAGVFPAGADVHLADFEDADGPWQVCFTIDRGQRIGPGHVSGDNVPVTDSVDADDNAIDGDGTMGSSWFTPSSHLSITFDDATPAAGFVLTDADSNAQNITIEAYDLGGDLLMSQTYDAGFMDDVFTGTTQEDRFFGITGMNDELIKRIRVSIDRGTGIEIDHLQFVKGNPVPEPAGFALCLCGLIGLGAARRRR